MRKRSRIFFEQLRKVLGSWWQILLLFWRANPVAVLCLLLLTLGTGLVPSLQIQITRELTNSVVAAIQHHGNTALTTQSLELGIAQAAILVVLMLAGTGQSYLQTLLQLQTTNEINIQIMEKALTLEIQHFEDHELYDKLQRATRESSYRPFQIFTQMFTLFSQIITLLSVVVILFSWSWITALLVLCSPLPAFCWTLFFSQKNYQLERERAPERRRLAYLQMLTTTARSTKEVRLFQLGDLFLQRYRRLYTKFYRDDKRILKQQTLATGPFNVLSIGIIAGAQISAIFSAILQQQVGLLTAYIQAISVVETSSQAILTGLGQLYQNNLFVSNLFEFLNTSATQIKGGARRFPEPLQKGIEFRHISFIYPGTTRKVLDDINVFLPAGSCTALVGSNGAGKTTMVKLLTRLYEASEGQILIDDVPIEEYNLNDLRQHISAIFQDFVQYEMSVRENIGFGRQASLEDEAAIHRAAQLGGAAEVIENLPQRYETTLGRMFERGHELSIGQWQKMALARAFMRQASVVILDEPTASIDAEAEAETFGKLRSMAKGATALLIAHRFSTIRIADRILVLTQGKITEDGTHEMLMEANGIYARLFRLQAAGYTESESPFSLIDAQIDPTRKPARTGVSQRKDTETSQNESLSWKSTRPLKKIELCSLEQEKGAV